MIKVSIIGLGLIGGSLGIDLKKSGFASKIYGVDSNPEHGQTALKRQLIDELVDLKEAINQSQLILLAIPVDACLKILPEILNTINDTKVVCDLSSTKELLINSVSNNKNFSRFVPSHPMAGTEFTGPTAALSGLFDYKHAIICNKNSIAPDALALIEKMYDVLNMKLVFMDAKLHDTQTAYVSHLSHISAFALSLTVMHKEKNDKHIFELASGGFSSTVRLAKSAASMWAPIFIQNKKNVLKVLTRYQDTLRELYEKIENEDLSGINELIEEANRIKNVIDRNDLIEEKRKTKIS